MNKKIILAASILLFSCNAEARDQIRIVGSSTVYPFTTTVAEQFGKKGTFKTPIVESTGTGGGFKLFCAGTGDDTPDFSDASRRIKPTELLECYKNKITDIAEIKIGYDGIVLANSIKAPRFSVSVNDLFLALAKKIPSKADPKKLADNTFKTWKEVNPTLPDQKIEVYGPPPTSGTRDSFVELVMEAGCWHLDAYKQAYADLEERKKACHQLREDGGYIDSGENDNLIVQKLNANKNALGIFGFSYLEQNHSIVQGSQIGGIAPTRETIANGTYVVSRPLYIYAKKAHFATVTGMKEFINEFVSDNAIGEFGYLIDKGLVPLHPDELKSIQSDVKNGKSLENLADEEKAALNNIKSTLNNLQTASGIKAQPAPAATQAK